MRIVRRFESRYSSHSSPPPEPPRFEVERPVVLKDDGAPPTERVTSENFSLNSGPALAVVDGNLVDPPEALDTPEERRRLLMLLREDQNLSGIPGTVLLDQHRIPPQTIELAQREGQIARAERGLGLARKVGGPW
jgi:hypothetical protein